MQMFGHIQSDAGRGLELPPTEIGAAHSQRRQPLDRALHSSAHGAGIKRVGAEVGAMVNTGKHQIRPLLQQGKQGQFHAIAGGAAAGPGLNAGCEQLIGPLGPQGRLQSEPMAGGRALLIRADHAHLMAAARGLRR